MTLTYTEVWALILGLAALTAVIKALGPVLLGALKVHLPNGFVFSYPNGGWEYPAFLIVISAVQALIGEGAYALGRIAARSRLAHA